MQGIKHKEKGSLARRITKGILIFLLCVTVFIIIVGISFAIYVAASMEREIDESLFGVLSGNSSSKLYYYERESDGSINETAIELKDQELYGGYRSKYAAYEELPEDLINAFVSIEDRRFFSHNGVDWKRTIGAGLNYFFNFRDNFGGSTITQQLIKNVTEEDDYSFQRKIQEILWALDLETKMSKEEILENYLNIINLSQGCYGVGAAADYYFSKEVEELSLVECAAIAAITNNPSYYDPLRNPQNNKARRGLILTQMYEQGYIGEEEYNEAYGSDIIINITKEKSSSGVNLWYVDMVVDDIINDLVAQKGYSRSMANLLLYRGGLSIYTAMDYDIQLILESYYSETDNFSYSDEGEDPQSSMIIIDPYTGDILAVAGAVGEKKADRIQNFATETVRPAGSVIKPLSVYAPALEEGIITWSSVYDDVPVNFGSYDLNASDGAALNLVAWPKNASGVYRGLTNINYAIEHSVNTVTVKVLEDVGLYDSFAFLTEKLKMTSLISGKTASDGRFITDIDYAALALGQFNYGVSVREISAAYSVFANSGIYNDYRSYYKVSDSMGNIILENEYHGEAVISEENSILMTEMLKNVVENGTATGVSLKKYIDCAGKTGTTQNNYDRWFIGYTPYFIGGVWYGYEYPKALPSGTGNLCIEIWDEVMTILHQKYISAGEARSFPSSANIVSCEYCADSGQLATNACKKDPRGNRIEEGYFVKGTEPTEKCECHILVEYDTEYGGVAFEGCPDESTETVGLIQVERNFPIEVYVSDAQYVWKNIGNTVPETSPYLPFFNNLLKENEYCGVSVGGVQYNRYCKEHFNYFEWKEKIENSE